jgi:nucleoside-diphosphate kinase
MKEYALILIKPDGVKKKLIGHIINKFAKTDLELVSIRMANVTRELAEKHYKHIKGQPFFDDVIAYLTGALHNEKRIVVMVYYGKDAIKNCRDVAGATNPEEAEPPSIRGSFGRITTAGVYENVVHVSSSHQEARREMKLWLLPRDFVKLEDKK